MSTTTNKLLTEPANGSLNWDVPLNANFTAIDQALGSSTTLNPTSGSTTLSSGTYIPLIIKIANNEPASNVTYTVPSGVGGQWIVVNQYTGSKTITFASGGGGASVTVPNNAQTAVISDGTNVYLVTPPASSTVASINFGSTGLTPASATTGAVTVGGTLGVANGGTGLATLTANNVILGNGTSAPTFVAPGANGNILTSDGTTWTSVPSSGGTGTVTSVATGVGLTGGPITASGTISLVTTAGAVGVYASFFQYNSGSPVTVFSQGTSYGGSTIGQSGGTWRCMSNQNTTQANDSPNWGMALFLRIA
jgi:hypothetical protein